MKSGIRTTGSDVKVLSAKISQINETSPDVPGTPGGQNNKRVNVRLPGYKNPLLGDPGTGQLLPYENVGIDAIDHLTKQLIEIYVTEREWFAKVRCREALWNVYHRLEWWVDNMTDPRETEYRQGLKMIKDCIEHILDESAKCPDEECIKEDLPACPAPYEDHYGGDFDQSFNGVPSENVVFDSRQKGDKILGYFNRQASVEDVEWLGYSDGSLRTSFKTMQIGVSNKLDMMWKFRGKAKIRFTVNVDSHEANRLMFFIDDAYVGSWSETAGDRTVEFTLSKGRLSKLSWIVQRFTPMEGDTDVVTIKDIIFMEVTGEHTMEDGDSGIRLVSTDYFPQKGTNSKDSSLEINAESKDGVPKETKFILRSTTSTTFLIKSYGGTAVLKSSTGVVLEELKDESTTLDLVADTYTVSLNSIVGTSIELKDIITTTKDTDVLVGTFRPRDYFNSLAYREPFDRAINHIIEGLSECAGKISFEYALKTENRHIGNSDFSCTIVNFQAPSSEIPHTTIPNSLMVHDPKPTWNITDALTLGDSNGGAVYDLSIHPSTAATEFGGKFEYDIKVLGLPSTGKYVQDIKRTREGSFIEEDMRGKSSQEFPRSAYFNGNNVELNTLRVIKPEFVYPNYYLADFKTEGDYITFSDPGDVGKGILVFDLTDPSNGSSLANSEVKNYFKFKLNETNRHVDMTLQFRFEFKDTSPEIVKLDYAIEHYNVMGDIVIPIPTGAVRMIIEPVNVHGIDSVYDYNYNGNSDYEYGKPKGATFTWGLSRVSKDHPLFTQSMPPLKQYKPYEPTKIVQDDRIVDRNGSIEYMNYDKGNLLHENESVDFSLVVDKNEMFSFAEKLQLEFDDGTPVTEFLSGEHDLINHHFRRGNHPQISITGGNWVRDEEGRLVLIDDPSKPLNIVIDVKRVYINNLELFKDDLMIENNVTTFHVLGKTRRGDSLIHIKSEIFHADEVIDTQGAFGGDGVSHVFKDDREPAKENYNITYDYRLTITADVKVVNEEI